MGRIDDPAEHVLAVNGLHPAFFDLAESEVVVEIFVFASELAHLGLILAELERIDLVGLRHAVALGVEHLTVGRKSEEHIVGHVVGEGHVLPLKVRAVHLRLAMPDAREVQRLVVGCPAKFVHAALELLRDVLLLARLEVKHAEACAVAFVSVTLHAAPRDVASIGGELRVLVVAHVAVGSGAVDTLVLQRTVGFYFGSDVIGWLAEVARLAGGEVVEVDVAVGADGVGFARFPSAGIGHLFAVGAPRELFHAAEGHHGAFVGFAFKQVFLHFHALAVEGGNEGMGRGSDVGVPVLVHKVVDDHAGGEGEVGFLGFDGMVLRHFHDKQHLLLVGREEEVGHIGVGMGNLPTPSAVGVHLPELVTAALGGEEDDVSASVDVDCPTLAPGAGGKLARCAVVEVEGVEHGVALVLLYTIIGDGINGFVAAGRGLETAYASHGPEGFRSHAVGLERGGLPADEVCRSGLCVGGLHGDAGEDGGGQHGFEGHLV